MATTTTSSSEEYLQCNRCGELKEIDQFRTYLYKGKLKYRYECKACIKAYNAEYYKLIMSVPAFAKKAEARRQSNNEATRLAYQRRFEDPTFRESERKRHKEYRKRVNGKYFVAVDPLVPTLKEFLDLYGYDSAHEITGYHKDFLSAIVANKYNVIRVDVADTILTRLHGPSFTVLYTGAKKHFVDDHKGKFLGRKILV